MRRHLMQIAAVAATVTLAAMSLAAQSSSALPSWQAWIGCWTTAPVLGASIAGAPLVCITPTADRSVVDVTTIAGQKVVSTRRIDASGRDQSIDAKDCTGTQRAHWSADGKRVYLNSSANCAGVPRTMTGILALTPTGDWLDVQGIVAGEGENVRVARYRDAGVPSGLPAEIASALAGRGVANETARIASGAAVRPADVMEASKAVSAAVTEAWLLERKQAFALDANELVHLADAGVPSRVTDAMIAVSNPGAFNVAHRDVYSDTTVVGQRLLLYMQPTGPWDWGYAGRYGYGYGYNPYSYGYGGYGYGYYNPYGYASGYGYYGQPVIVIGNPQTGAGHGQMVKGQGYRGDPTAATTRTTSTSPSPSSSSAGSTSSGRSSSPSASSAPASAPRTAQPKP